MLAPARERWMWARVALAADGQVWRRPKHDWVKTSFGRPGAPGRGAVRCVAAFRCRVAPAHGMWVSVYPGRGAGRWEWGRARDAVCTRAW